MPNVVKKPRNELQAFSSRSSALRRMNPDGTITIVCRICGKPLIRSSAAGGFSTATCSDCAGIPTDDMVTGAITLPDGRVIYQPDSYDDAILYENKPEMEKVGLAKAVFRALGFGRPKEPVEPAKESKTVARERKRKPIFGPGSEDDDE